MRDIPLSLYIHIPWCVKKCPYCDFNSHTQKARLPENTYIDHLIEELSAKKASVQGRPIKTIFFGGGTPSLFHPDSYSKLLDEINRHFILTNDCEITLEANPGTLVPNRFEGYRQAGINRVSIGVQSFQQDKLKQLGRIHNPDDACQAIASAQAAGFHEINIDLMFGLPNQTVCDALHDLETANNFNTTHLSWYQLTLEPNTLFYRFPPKLPNDDMRYEIQQAGQAYLKNAGFNQYEISAYARSGKHQCQHNLNYWLFGDYIGIGAGAHGKITDLKTGVITRTNTIRHPKQYLERKPSETFLTTTVLPKVLPLEFMMNALRLHQAIPTELFKQRTFLNIDTISAALKESVEEELIHFNSQDIQMTPKGQLFLNELLMKFCE